MDVKTQPNILPSKVVDQLRAEWFQAQGAAQVANTAKQVAQGMFQAYQAHFTSCVQMLGVDAAGKYWVDFATGQVHEGDPPQPNTNGSVSGEHPAISQR